MDRQLRTTADNWLEEARPAIVVEVQSTRGSAPREAGTRMIVAAGEAVGTIGGGHLELKAIERARASLRAGPVAAFEEHFALGPSLGQCCGGAVTLGYRPLDGAALAAWPVPAPLFHLQLYGAGHVGRAIATLLATLDVAVDWIDEREDEFPRVTSLGSAWPAHVKQVCVDAVEAEVRHAPPGAFYLVLTHDHDLDLRITEAILRRNDFGYLGLIGSRTKRERFLRRFEQRGVPADAVARLHCPIGVERIDAKAPAIVACAVVAQLLQQLAPQVRAAVARSPIATIPKGDGA